MSHLMYRRVLYEMFYVESWGLGEIIIFFADLVRGILHTANFFDVRAKAFHHFW